jgi:sodium/bile acid cotransporter 7
MYINISPIEQSKMQIPAIIFQAFQVGVGGLMTIGFRRWIRSEEEKEEAEKEEAEKEEAEKEEAEKEEAEKEEAEKEEAEKGEATDAQQGK